MRTNIEIDDELMAKAMKASGAKTKKAAVEEALALLISTDARIKAQMRIRRLVGKVEFYEDYLTEMRSRRERR